MNKQKKQQQQQTTFTRQLGYRQLNGDKEFFFINQPDTD